MKLAVNISYNHTCSCLCMSGFANSIHEITGTSSSIDADFPVYAIRWNLVYVSDHGWDCEPRAVGWDRSSTGNYSVYPHWFHIIVHLDSISLSHHKPGSEMDWFRLGTYSVGHCILSRSLSRCCWSPYTCGIWWLRSGEYVSLPNWVPSHTWHVEYFFSSTYE